MKATEIRSKLSFSYSYLKKLEFISYIKIIKILISNDEIYNYLIMNFKLSDLAIINCDGDCVVLVENVYVEDKKCEEKNLPRTYVTSLYFDYSYFLREIRKEKLKNIFKYERK